MTDVVTNEYRREIVEKLQTAAEVITDEGFYLNQYIISFDGTETIGTSHPTDPDSAFDEFLEELSDWRSVETVFESSSLHDVFTKTDEDAWRAAKNQYLRQVYGLVIFQDVPHLESRIDEYGDLRDILMVPVRYTAQLDGGYFTVQNEGVGSGDLWEAEYKRILQEHGFALAD